MSAGRMHVDEVHTDASLAGRLIAAQFPQWADLPIEPVHSASTDNAMNERARRELGWSPRYDFQQALGRLRAGEDPRSPLSVAVGAKGYHAVSTGIYTVR